MRGPSLRSLACLGVLLMQSAGLGAATAPPPWHDAWQKKGPMSAEETQAFIERLARFVLGNHLKTAPESPQRGMLYEYFNVARKGHYDQFIQGEGLDTMHDGAWFAAAMVNAARATGEPLYRQVLADWQMPFYCKMLNHSDELFTTEGAVARKGARPWGKPWAYQEGEKGFIPYFWDNGGSVSIERRRSNNPLGPRPCHDNLAGKSNPRGLLDGYSLGMSNHMAQDIGVMVMLAWLLFKDGEAPKDQRLADTLAEAAMNLHQSRVRHHGFIPMCVAPAALANRSAELMRRVPDPESERYWAIDNHYVRALYRFEPGKRYPFPGFADDIQYKYYYSIACSGGELTRPIAFRTLYDAFTEPLLYRYYCDDQPPAPGINRFDLHTYYCADGKPTDYRSDRKGPHRRPRPIGSRMGPQTMIAAGWALKALEQYPGIWKQAVQRHAPDDLRVYIDDPPPGAKSWETPIVETTLGGLKLDLVGQRSALKITLKPEQLCVSAILYSRPDGKGTHAVVRVRDDGAVEAANGQGEPLKTTCRTVQGAEGRAEFCVVLPYTVVKGQAPWANGIELGRYSVQVAEETRNVILASSERQVAAWLKHELSGGLRTWQAIFDQKGYIPTGMGTGQEWDGFSDTGGYAHLVSAAAQWLFLLTDRRDWAVHNIPNVPGPK